MNRKIRLFFAIIIIAALIVTGCRNTTDSPVNDGGGIIDMATPNVEATLANIGLLEIVTEPETIIETETKTDEHIIQSIDERVSWIKDNRGEYVDGGKWGGHFMGFEYADNGDYRDYYNNDVIVWRKFRHDCTYDSEKSDASYDLYYDENGYLIRAEIVHYRGAMYDIYFQNDILLYTKVGPFSYNMSDPFIDGDFECVEDVIKQDPFYTFVLEDISICLENGYK